MSFLAKTQQLFEELRTITESFSDRLNLNLQTKIQLLKEDFMLSHDSYYAKDAIKNPKITKKTEKFAHDYYSVKVYQILKELYRHENSCSRDIIRLMVKIQNQIPYSLHHQDEFKNPYPDFLLFSQEYHANHFSSKSQREGVSGVSLDEIAEQLKTQELSPDYLRVNIYFAPFRQELKPFVYNNRTWVVFSKAEVEATRIVPIIPTQDLLNRIKKLSPEQLPSVITDENNPKNKTYSLKFPR